jgi:hypothetical protein
MWFSQRLQNSHVDYLRVYWDNIMIEKCYYTIILYYIILHMAHNIRIDYIMKLALFDACVIQQLLKYGTQPMFTRAMPFKLNSHCLVFIPNLAMFVFFCLTVSLQSHQDHCSDKVTLQLELHYWLTLIILFNHITSSLCIVGMPLALYALYRQSWTTGRDCYTPNMYECVFVCSAVMSAPHVCLPSNTHPEWASFVALRN